MRRLVTIFIFILGLIASAVGIVQFVTGNQSLDDLRRQLGMSGATPQSGLAAVEDLGSTRAPISAFQPVTRLAPDQSGVQQIFAVEPGRLLAADTVVRLTCTSASECLAERILTVPARLGYVDTIILSTDGARLAVLNRGKIGQFGRSEVGAGLLYSFADRTYTEFAYALPCVFNEGIFGISGQVEGGFWTLHEAVLEGDTLRFKGHGLECGGTGLIGNAPVDVPRVLDRTTGAGIYYEVAAEFSFDTAGYLSSGGFALTRVARTEREARDWFRLASTRSATQ